MMNVFKFLPVLVLTIGLAGCFSDKKADIIKKSEGASDKAALEEALGSPDTINKTGPIEQWIYKADDGEVVFTIVGGKVAIDHTN